MNKLTWQSTLARPQMWVALARMALIIMDLTLFSLWYQALFRTVPFSWSVEFGLLAVVMVTSFGLARMMEAQQTRLLLRQALFLAWSGLAMFATLKMMVFAGIEIGFREMLSRPIQFITLEGSDGASFFHLLVILVLIWRGVALAGGMVTVWSVLVHFQLGLLGLLVYGIALASGHPREAITGLFLYLFFGLISLSAARIASLAEMRDGRVPRFSPAWLAGIIFTGLAVVLLALLGGWLASGQLVAWLIQALILILTLMATLLMLLLRPVLSVLARGLDSVVDFLQGLANASPSFRLPKFLEDLIVEIAQGIEKALPAVVAGRGMLLGVILVLLLLLVLAGLRIRGVQPNLVEEEDSGSVARAEDSLWRKLAQRMMPGVASLRRRSPAQLFAAARIRQIYRQLMNLSQKMGAERPPSLTPLEFLPRLVELFPDEQGGLDQITNAYLQVRYGEYPETLREVEEVQRAWDRIRRQARSQRAAPKKD